MIGEAISLCFSSRSFIPSIFFDNLINVKNFTIISDKFTIISYYFRFREGFLIDLSVSFVFTKVVPTVDIESNKYNFYYTAGTLGLAGGKIFDFSVTQ
ncbi:MAG: hypothetical protein ABI891_13705 [Acidobacteriota bacterium]